MELGGLPRPEPLSLDPRIRWRHMYDGTLQGQTLSSSAAVAGSASGSSSLNNSTNSSNNLLEGLDSSESGSESDLDLQNLASIRGPLRFVYPRRHSPRRLRWGPLDQRRLGGSPHASRFGFVIFYCHLFRIFHVYICLSKEVLTRWRLEPKVIAPTPSEGGKLVILLYNST